MSHISYALDPHFLCFPSTIAILETRRVFNKYLNCLTLFTCSASTAYAIKKIKLMMFLPASCKIVLLKGTILGKIVPFGSYIQPNELQIRNLAVIFTALGPK